MIFRQPLVSLIMIVVCAAGIAGQSTLLRREAAPAPTDARPSRPACPVTDPVRAEPPKDPNADPFGYGPWYANADRTIWASFNAENWTSGGGGTKVLWIRPQGTTLKITGRRLDAEAPGLRASIPCCYPTGFQATRLFFPTGGCWEVSAKAGGNALTFVTKVQ